MDYVALKLAAAPGDEPVATLEAKEHLRVDTTDHDLYIGTLIQTAREVVEEISGRALVTQTWDLVLDEFPGGDTIELPRPPLQSITSITYTDEDGNSDTVSSSDYVVDTYSEPGRIVLKSGSTWPGDTLQEAAAVVVKFVAGYGDADDVPQRYKQAVLLLVGHYYEHPEAVSEVRKLEELPLGVRHLLYLDRFTAF